MPPDTEARTWLSYARADLRMASHDTAGPDDGPMRDLCCFHSQQAAEKALKGVLVSRGMAVPRIHNVAALLAIVTDAPSAVQQAASLSAHATAGRYPETGHSTEHDLAEAIELARTVVEWAEQQIGT